MNSELLAVISLLLCSAFFSASETAFTSLTLMQIKEVQKRHKSLGRLLENLYNKPELIITTILIGNNIVNTSIATLSSVWADHTFGRMDITLITGAVTMAILFFGEVTPKQLALIFNVPIACFSIRILYGLSFLFRPIIWAFTLVSRFIGLFRRKRSRNAITIEGLLHMVQHAQTMGLLDVSETRMIKGVLRFSDVSVHSIMTHRTDVFSLDAESSLEAALPQVLESGYAQIPVYSQNKENIVGIIREKNLLRSLCGQDDGLQLKQIMESPVFLAENWNVQRVFQRLKQQKASMGIVIDEYGGLSGIVTLNDLVSQIVGDLDEEHSGFKERLKSNDDGSIRIPGEEPLYHLEELAGHEVSEARSGMNVAAYIESIATRIPEAGETIETALGQMKIHSLDGTCISQIDFFPNKKIDK